MKLPALCLAVTFAGGVALGLFSPLVNLATSVAANRTAFFLALTLLAACVLSLRKNLTTFTAILSLGAWLLIDAGGQPPTYAGQTAQRGPDPGEDAVSRYQEN